MYIGIYDPPPLTSTYVAVVVGNRSLWEQQNYLPPQQYTVNYPAAIYAAYINAANEMSPRRATLNTLTHTHRLVK